MILSAFPWQPCSLSHHSRGQQTLFIPFSSPLFACSKATVNFLLAIPSPFLPWVSISIFALFFHLLPSHLTKMSACLLLKSYVFSDVFECDKLIKRCCFLLIPLSLHSFSLCCPFHLGKVKKKNYIIK